MSLDKILLSEKKNLFQEDEYFIFPLLCYLWSNIIIEMENKPVVYRS